MGVYQQYEYDNSGDYDDDKTYDGAFFVDQMRLTAELEQIAFRASVN